MRHTPQQPKQSTELAKPREALPSGALRVASPEELRQANDPRSGHRISRPNAPVRALPSILVDASYLQAVSSVRARMRARRRILALTAIGAFLCGIVALPLPAELARREAAAVSASDVVKNVGASLGVPRKPVSAAPDSAPPHRTRMDQSEAARHVHDAQELRRAGQVREAWHLLTEVLRDRPGYPPGLAAMAELKLDCGQAAASLRWARLAVRALPSSVENRKLLSRARAAAGLRAESTHARLP